MEDITGYIEAKKQDYTEILCNLIRQKTVLGDEHLAAEIIKPILEELDIPFDIAELEPGRPNILAYVGNPDGKKLIIPTHMDVVPAGDGWTTDPFEPVIKDNHVFGRGACDNKGQLTSALLAAEILKQHESELDGQIIFAFCSDEELGSNAGMKFLLKENLISADFGIIPDIGGSMKNIDIAEKGVLNLSIAAVGKQTHGSVPEKGRSAIVMMSALIEKLKSHTLTHEPHKYLTSPTINFGTIKGGSALNTVAAKCKLEINIRYLPSQDAESLIAEIKAIAEPIGEFTFETIINSAPSEIPDDHPLVLSLMKITKDLGVDAKPFGLSGATDAKKLNHAGIPAVGFDFADDDIAHMADEYVRLDQLFKFSEILAKIAVDLLKSS